MQRRSPARSCRVAPGCASRSGIRRERLLSSARTGLAPRGWSRSQRARGPSRGSRRARRTKSHRGSEPKAPCRLDRQPSLSGSAWARERDHSRSPDERADGRDVIRSADEARQGRRQTRLRERSLRPKRREVGCQSGRHDLVKMLGPRKIPKGMAPEIDRRRPGPGAQEGFDLATGSPRTVPGRRS